MSLLNRLERRLEPYAITNLTLFLVIGQVFVLLTSMLQLIDPGQLLLIPSYVTAGEWWRLFSFVFIPPDWSPWFVAFALYLFYIYGTALEQYWGPLRYNLFWILGWLLTSAFSFVAPYSVTSNIFIFSAILLSFAWLHPNFELLLFFVLPVKVVWIAVMVWATRTYEFFTQGLSTKLAFASALSCFLLFFGRDILRTLRQSGRRTQQLGRTGDKTAASEARHTCSVCQRTELTNPELDFRYAADDRCYCSDHLPSRKTPTPAGNTPPPPSA